MNIYDNVCEAFSVMWRSFLDSAACVAQPILQILAVSYIERNAGKNFSYLYTYEYTYAYAYMYKLCVNGFETAVASGVSAHFNSHATFCCCSNSYVNSYAYI